MQFSLSQRIIGFFSPVFFFSPIKYLGRHECTLRARCKKKKKVFV